MMVLRILDTFVTSPLWQRGAILTADEGSGFSVKSNTSPIIIYQNCAPTTRAAANIANDIFHHCWELERSIIC